MEFFNYCVELVTEGFECSEYDVLIIRNINYFFVVIVVLMDQVFLQKKKNCSIFILLAFWSLIVVC